MNVLSLFDGISGAQLALKRAGIKVDNYYASEIDKYAIKVTQKNFPDTIQLGDVTTVNCQHLPKIDLLIGGSPCQGFSVAGHKLNFDDPRSKLFFEYVRILNELKHLNPNIKFILENVKMKQEHRDIISEHLGVEPVLINSALVSGQNRERYYWANFPITQPQDKGILLKDVVQDGEVDRDKAYCIDANYFKGGSEATLKRLYFEKSRRQIIRIGTAEDIKGHDYNRRVYSTEGKCPTLAAKSGGNLEPKIAIDDVHYRKLTPLECERLQTFPDNYTEGVSNTQRYKALGNAFTVDVIKHILEDWRNHTVKNFQTKLLVKVCEEIKNDTSIIQYIKAQNV